MAQFVKLHVRRIYITWIGRVLIPTYIYFFYDFTSFQSGLTLSRNGNVRLSGRGKKAHSFGRNYSENAAENKVQMDPCTTCRTVGPL